MSSVSSSQPSSANSGNPVAGFGTNEWLVEEMYQQYLADPGSVDQAWHDFFADYRPGSPVSDGQDRAGGLLAGAAVERGARPVVGEELVPRVIDAGRIGEVLLVHLLDQPLVGAESSDRGGGGGWPV